MSCILLCLLTVPFGACDLMRAYMTSNQLHATQVDRKVAMEVLDMDCMQAVGLISDVNVWRQKETRYNTRKAYTVNK